MNIEWGEVQLPEFSMPEERPEIPVQLYDERCRKTYTAAKRDWLVIYGDREHYANLAFLTGFDPRFEEALLLLGPEESRILVVGNEGVDYARLINPNLDVVLCQSFSLMGQDRSIAPRVIDVLRDASINRGQRIGVIGWKYLEPEEVADGFVGFFAPALLIDSLRALAGDPDAVDDTTWVLMHPARGLRAHNEVEQIAVFEWAGARATQAMWRIVRGIKPGMTELDAVSNMGFSGDPLSTHVMFASGQDKIVGIRSPTTRRIEQGDGAFTAIGFWGGLGCRGGLIDKENLEFLSKIAIPYYRGLATWYQTIHLGIEGGEVFEQISEVLAMGGLRSLLNPGHLTSLEEWVRSPIRPGSTDRITSGMAFQVDIIPTPMPPGWAMNCEDPVIFADEDLRRALSQHYPHVWSRIQARQKFMRENLGIQIRDEILPISSIPAYLPPLWLSSSKGLTLV